MPRTRRPARAPPGGGDRAAPPAQAGTDEVGALSQRRDNAACRAARAGHLDHRQEATTTTGRAYLHKRRQRRRARAVANRRQCRAPIKAGHLERRLETVTGPGGRPVPWQAVGSAAGAEGADGRTAEAARRCGRGRAWWFGRRAGAGVGRRPRQARHRRAA